MREASAATLSSALGLDLETPRRKALVVALVGAGGKTSAAFALAREGVDSRVALTTTTMIRDPRLEAGRRYDRVAVDDGRSETVFPRAGAGPFVLASGVDEAAGKLRGIAGGRVEVLSSRCDLMLVEADGSRGLSVKAPAAWEPVVPACADLVLGLIGLDCLGAPLGPETAHRPELLGPLVGCAQGEALRAEHLARLAASPEGLFKGAPVGARCAILLNKSDSASSDEARKLVELLMRGQGRAELVVVCSLRGETSRVDSVIELRRAAEAGA
jgi:probable selenium-dependent hydroxylase accessory protein YqeC